MRLTKKVISVVVIAIIAVFAYALKAEAATVKVTEDLLNLRKEASTSSKILVTLSENTECELIEEDGEWYKVKYKTYTGYVASKYTKLIEDTEDTNNEQEVNTNNEENNVTDTVVEENEKEATGKLSKDTVARILPLINSGVIGNLKKDAEVTIITETTGWSYISTDEISAWIRSDSITGKKTDTTNETAESNNDTTTEPDDTEIDKEEVTNETTSDNTTTTDSEFKQKIMYTNDSYVNVRKEPSTSSRVLMILTLNTKLTVIGEEGDWYKVNTSMGNAYVSKKLLSDTEKKTTSRGNVIIRGATSTGDIETSNKVESTTNKTTTVTTTTSNKVTNANKNTNTNTNTNTTTSSKGKEIVEYAKKFLNVPYVYGGATPKGFDCSGFTMYVYKQFGISMRHGAQAQAKLGTAVNADKNSASSLKQNLKIGDLVFFLDYETMDEIGHCGIYIGDGNFIHASSGTGYCVKINSLLPGEYYNTRYCAARRVI